MVLAASVVWVGLSAWEEDLIKSIVEVPAVMNEELNVLAEGVLHEAQANVEANLKHPDIDTGEVAASGSVQRDHDGATVSFAHRAAAFVHEGARGNEAHRFFLSKPAQEVEPEVEAAGVEAVRRSL